MTVSYLLPTGTDMDLLDPMSSEYAEVGQVVYVVERIDLRAGTFRALSSWGPLLGYDIGTVHEIVHDQTHRRLGRYRVIGILDLRDDVPTHTGKIPPQTVQHLVFK